MISGTKEGFDVEDLKENTQYKTLQGNSREAKWLWEILSEFDD